MRADRTVDFLKNEKYNLFRIFGLNRIFLGEVICIPNFLFRGRG